MNARGRRARALLGGGVVALAACTAGGCAQIFGIDSPNPVPEPGDGGDGGDATLASDGATTDSASSTDVTVSDAPFVDTSSPVPSDDANDGATAQDACAAILSRMLSAPITPPTQWAGIDLSNGGQYQDFPGGGGITLSQAGVAACAGWTEPRTLDDGGVPLFAGYRAALFSLFSGTPTQATAPIAIYSNMQSGEVEHIVLQKGYEGTVSFSSRDGGSYGSHSYEIGIGFCTRDDQPFGGDWGDGGTLTTAMPWMNEIYDGMMATFSPTTPPLANGDCLSTIVDGYWDDSLEGHYSACLANPSDFYFGVRPLGAYFVFASKNSTNVATMYNFWWGGSTSCATTPIAATEAMDYAGIYMGEGEGSIGTALTLTGGLGDLTQSEYASNLLGLTFAEANELECNGVAVSAPDPGYGAIEWGQFGEAEMEYVLDGGVNYRLYAHTGYKGLFRWTVSGDDFSTGIGVPVTKNGSEDAGSTNALATSLTNGVCSFSDTDCVDAGHCTVILNDGSGNTYLGVSCGYPADLLGIEFSQGTNTPTEIFTTNPNLE
ncbi:MAG: hypothetical protein ACLQVI_02670 [Polyangiaceae bacterium]